MKLITPIMALTAIVAFAAAPPVRAQADNDAVKAKIKAMEDAWAKSQMDADHGAAAVSDMLASDYAGISSKGKMQDKAAFIARIKDGTDTYTSTVNDVVDVNVYAPNLAVVRGKSTEAGKDKDGKEFKRSFIWTDTWMQRNGKWECIASVGAPLKEEM
jgi:cytochrome c5